MDEQFKLGNIRDNSINDIQSNPVLNELVLARAKRKTKNERCCRCMWRNFCQGSCMGVVLEQHGTIWETDEFCDFRIALFEQSVIKLAEEKNLHPRKNIGDTTSECY